MIEKTTITIPTSGDASVTLTKRPQALMLWWVGQGTSEGSADGYNVGFGFVVPGQTAQRQANLYGYHQGVAHAGNSEDGQGTTDTSQALHPYLTTIVEGTLVSGLSFSSIAYDWQCPFLYVDDTTLVIDAGADSPTSTQICHVLAFSDIGNASVVMPSLAASGTEEMGLGHNPDVMFAAGSAGNGGPSGHMGTGFGAAVGTDSSEQWGLGCSDEDNLATTDTDSWADTGRIVGAPWQNSSLNTANISAISNGTVTLTRTAGFTNRSAPMLCMSGIDAEVFTFTTPTGAAPQTTTISGLSFAPEAYILGTVGLNSTSITDGASMSIGAAVKDGSQGCGSIWSQHNVATSNCGRFFETDEVIQCVSSAGTLLCEANAGAFTGDGFKLNFTTTNGTARNVYGVAMRTGPNPTPIIQQIRRYM